MKTNEYEYYNNLANWSFDDIKYSVENFTNWIYEDEIAKYSNPNSKILDLGTAAGEKVLKYFPNCSEILGTDFSKEMINNANKNLEKSGRKNISFRVMDNLNMDTQDNYFNLVTARHTITDPKQIYKSLKKDGHLLIRGVDKLDCWELKRMFKRGQGFYDKKPISLIDYEAVLEEINHLHFDQLNQKLDLAIQVDLDDLDPIVKVTDDLQDFIDRGINPFTKDKYTFNIKL